MSLFRWKLSDTPVKKLLQRAIFGIILSIACNGTKVFSDEMPDFSSIYINREELQNFLTLIQDAAIHKDYQKLCSKLYYPILVSVWRDYTLELSSIDVKTEQICMSKKLIIFDNYLLKNIISVKPSDLSETKAMIMAYNGTFWISRFQAHADDPRGNSQAEGHNDYYWPIKIVNINKNH